MPQVIAIILSSYSSLLMVLFFVARKCIGLSKAVVCLTVYDCLYTNTKGHAGILKKAREILDNF